MFGRQLRFDLGESFPLLTTKKLHLKSIIYELLWFLRGDTNVRWLQEHGVTHLGRMGRRAAASSARSTATSGATGARRTAARSTRSPSDRESEKPSRIRGAIIVTAWNPADVDRMALPPCHALFQFYVADGGLSCQMYQRSADLFLGVPFNIASYALLTLMVAQVTGLEPGEFVHTLGDAHLYLNHLEQAREQLSRAPKPFPRMKLNPAGKELLDFQYEDFTLEGYDPHPAIKAPIAV